MVVQASGLHREMQARGPVAFPLVLLFTPKGWDSLAQGNALGMCGGVWAP